MEVTPTGTVKVPFPGVVRIPVPVVDERFPTIKSPKEVRPVVVIEVAVGGLFGRNDHDVLYLAAVNVLVLVALIMSPGDAQFNVALAVVNTVVAGVIVQ